MINHFFIKLHSFLLILAVAAVASSSAFANATITIQNNDIGTTGFNDPTPVAPIGGNNGTTLGQQRMNAFQFAANIWGATLNSSQTITIGASWVALPCSSNSAVLAQSGTTTVHANFPNGLPGIFYSAALANALSGSDRNGTEVEIDAEFNVNVGNANCLSGSPFYLGFDGAHGGSVDLVTTLLHEFAHGLGFQAFTSLPSGSQIGQGAPGIFDKFLRDNTTGKLWSQMTDAERAASAINNGNLVWDGPQVTTDSPNVLGTPRLRVNSPGAIAGNYSVGTADFGPSISAPGLTGNVVKALDAADGVGPSTTDGCSAFTNAGAVFGNIAFIDRGTCNFIDKVKNAQAAGATGVIIGNVFNSPNPGNNQIMGAVGPPVLISIPSVQLIFADAESIRAQLQSNINASILLDHSVPLGSDSSNRVRMFAPNSFQDGSSVSHFDSTAFPNLLMEASSTGDVGHSVIPPQDLTFSLLRDIGWTGVGSTPSIQFDSPTVNAAESIGSMNVFVTRTGDTSGASSVDYATSDTSGNNACSVVSGAASSHCDYIQTLGKLQFAAGETQKVIQVPLVNDSFFEGSETFTMTLSNPSGATLGLSTATLTILDNDSTTGPNPIDLAVVFVRQHYIDFLNREPDQDGFNFWQGQILSCGSDPQCIELKRINVSGAFFLSIEFQETGYLVYRVYKSAFGNLTTPPGAPVPIVLSDFLRDTQKIGQGVVVNAPGADALLEANKVAYMLAFVQRPDFVSAYPNGMSPTDFVTQLSNRAGGPTVITPTEQANLVAMFGGSTADVNKRAQVLRAVADDSTLRDVEFNKAFVLMQYFGYLRRNPNEGQDINFDGYNFWLNKLNQFNGNFVNAEMVKSFLISGEYRQRFGP